MPLPVGAYRGERPATGIRGPDPVVDAQLRRVDLTIEEGGRATLEDAGIPWEGIVTRRGDRLDFEVLTVAGVNIARQAKDLPRRLEFSVGADGTIVYGGLKLAPREL